MVHMFVVMLLSSVLLFCDFLLVAEASYGTGNSKMFLPAPPGERPPCAKDGETYCNEVDYYPSELIRYLLDNYEYDFDSLLNSESSDQSPTSIPPPPKLPTKQEPLAGGAVFIPGSELKNLNDSLAKAKPLASASTHHPSRHSANHSSPHPTTRSPSGRSGHGDSRHKQTHQPVYYQPRSEPYAYTAYSRHEPWWQRYSEKPAGHRGVRQARDENTLCPTTFQFASPKAAVNTKGNWMFVVNVSGGNNELTQLVKTERCATAQCSGLCTVPLGFTSTCQQQFVQKRLVALNANGESLYHDVFWFPHCCICQIRQNS